MGCMDYLMRRNNLSNGTGIKKGYNYRQLGHDKLDKNKMTHHKRPLSPHLMIYRLPLTGIISITHRMTGVILAMGLLVYVASFFIILQGNESYLNLQSYLDYTLVRIGIWFFIYALFFHLCHGIRHLLWDVGSSFDKENMDRNAMIELVISFVLTLIFY